MVIFNVIFSFVSLLLFVFFFLVKQDKQQQKKTVRHIVIVIVIVIVLINNDVQANRYASIFSHLLKFLLVFDLFLSFLFTLKKMYI